MRVEYLLLMVGGVLISSVSQVLLKISANRSRVTEGILRQYLNPFVLIGYVLFAVAMVLPLIAYQYVDFKFGAVVESLAYFFVMVLSRVILKEKVTRNKIIGNILIIAGVILFSSGLFS